jgi:hypothetical protein
MVFVVITVIFKQCIHEQDYLTRKTTVKMTRN